MKRAVLASMSAVFGLCLASCPQTRTTTPTENGRGAVATDLLNCAVDNVDIARSSPLVGASSVAGQWDSAEPGIGFNYLTGQLAGKCISSSPPSTSTSISKTSDNAVAKEDSGVCNPVLGTQSYKIQIAESVESLSRHLEASVSANARGIAWSASGASSFAETYSVSTTSRFLLIEAAVELRSETGRDFELTRDAAALLTKDPPSFRRTCGDHFVRSVWHGGRFQAVYHFKSKTEEQASALTASMRANFGAGSFGTSAEFRSAISRFSSSTSLDVFVVKSGGGFSKIGTDPTALLEGLNTFFCNINAGNAPAVRVELAGYDSVNFKGHPLQYTGNHSDAMAGLERLRGRVLSEREHYQSEAQRVAGDCPAAATEFSTVAMSRTAALQQIANMANECKDMQPGCRRCADLSASAPKIEPSKAKCEPCASDGGIGVAVNGFCRKCTWPIGDLDVSDAKIGEGLSQNVLVEGRTCSRMEPSAPTEIRVKGSFSLHLSNDGAGCQMTCIGQDSKSKIFLRSRDVALDAREYCVGTFDANKTHDFSALALGVGAPWWAKQSKVNTEGQESVGLLFDGQAYGCDRPRHFNRTEQLRGLVLEVCQIGYCN